MSAKKQTVAETKKDDVNYYLVPEALIQNLYNYINTKPRKEVNHLAVAMENLKKTTNK